MLEILANAGRSVVKGAYDQFLGTFYAKLIENLDIVHGHNRLELLDEDGKLCSVRRERRYAVKWQPEDYLPLERISVGPTGTIKVATVVEPSATVPEIIEGGLGEHFIVFRIRAPELRPTYLVKKDTYLDMVLEYEAENVYTKEAEPMSWVIRLPRGRPLPGSFSFELKLPVGRPMLAQPRTYRIADLAHAETALTDLGIDKSEAWGRLHNPSSESNIVVAENLRSLRWCVKPHRKNTAYKIEWDWWEHS